MLSILGTIYGKVMNLRNRLYEKGVFDSFDLGARTISVGNITTGGTGKTPLVAYIANLLAERGETVCILTRGYGRSEPKKRVVVSNGKEILATPAASGDEPYELATKLLGKAIVIADADRVSAGEWAKREFGVTYFILDDGFQHRRVRRDVDIVCIDATNPFGGKTMLPAGRLREPMAELKRATAILITRSDLMCEDEISNLKSEISNLAPEVPVFAAVNKLAPIDIGGNAAFAFCGIGNPTAFFEQLARQGVNVVGNRTFRDHYLYSQADISSIEADALAVGADILLTTAKDAVKISNLKFEISYFVIEIEMVVDDVKKFHILLESER